MRFSVCIQGVMHTPPNAVAVGMYLFSNKQEQKRAQEKIPHAPSYSTTTSVPPYGASNRPPKATSGEGDHERGRGWQPYNTVGGDGGGNTRGVLHARERHR
jgi:hypothetical protein